MFASTKMFEEWGWRMLRNIYNLCLGYDDMVKTNV